MALGWGGGSEDLGGSSGFPKHRALEFLKFFAVPAWPPPPPSQKVPL